MSIQSLTIGHPSVYMEESANLTITELMEMKSRRLTVEPPESITDPLFDGSLDTVEPIGGTEKKRGLGQSVEPPHERVAVSIGMPEWWDLREHVREPENAAMPLLRDLLTRYDLFLVQFACSLTPSGDSTIESLEFSVSVVSSEDIQNAPVAHDLFPLNVSHTEERNLKLKLSPNVKFEKQIEVSLGEIAIDMKYQVVVPEVIAFGIGETNFGWILRGSSRWPLVGIRCFHTVVKRYKGHERIPLAVNLFVNMVTSRGIFRCKLAEEVTARLVSYIG